MRKIIAKALLFVLTVILILIALIIIRTLSFTSKQVKVDPADSITVDENNAIRHLAEAIQIPAVSFENEADLPVADFLKFHKYLQLTYPRIHKTLIREVINNYSLLYTWPGKDSKLRPLVLMAHLDVVPVEEKSKNLWTHPPFSGEVAEGFIWGRGALDNKGSLISILEAAEGLLAAGFQPARTVYIVSGHDEERGGAQGALKIVQLLKNRGVVPEFVLDEGMTITDGLMPGFYSRLALIGIAEKGFINLELSVKARGGHSSMPPRETAVGILCNAVARLERKPFPARIDGAAKYLFDYVGREMPFGKKIIFANLWLTEGLLKNELQKANSANAMIRTTTAPTMLEGSLRGNVLPTVARALINFRILPGDTPDSVLAYVRETISDPRVEIKPAGTEIQGPSPVARIESDGYLTIQKTIRQIFPDVTVAPSLAIVSSDSRHFAALTGDIYRFAPMIMKAEDIARLHGDNERIAVANYIQMIKFYRQLIVNSGHKL